MARPPLKTAVTSMLITLVSVAAIASMGVPVYVLPPVEEAQDADLVYVLGPPTRQRVDLARELLREGVADRALVSVPTQGEQSAARLSICSELDVECLHPVPSTTSGEARLLADYAAEEGVTSTIVVTFVPHVARTRYIFEKCYDGEVTVIAMQQHLNLGDWIYQYVYQWHSGGCSGSA